MDNRPGSHFVAALAMIIAIQVASLSPAAAGPVEDAIARTLLEEAADRTGDAATSFMVGVDQFYVERTYAPIWVSVGGINERGRNLIEVIGGVGADGLDPNDYRYLEVVALQGAGSKSDLARMDVLLSESLVWLAQHLSAGRLEPTLVERINNLYPVGVDPVDVLRRAVEAPDIASFVGSFAPDQEEYRRLKASLATYKQMVEDGIVWSTVPDGDALKPEMQDARVPLLRKSLVAHGDLDRDVPDVADRMTYGLDLQDAVKRFQIRHGLIDDAVVGKNTLAALNISLSERIEQIIINLERRRWMADDRGDRYVFVNLADFQMKIVDRGRTVFVSPIVVGTEYNQTPVFSDEMEYLEINPYWNVPPSIARGELLPKIKENPGYLAEHQFELLSDWSGGAAVVDPNGVDWSRMNAGNFNLKIRQRPGEGNALGRVKFMFPNEYDVYLHDTPARGLFSRETRTFSHGCVRVGDPIGLADVVLSNESGWTHERLMAVITSGERTIVPLRHRLPVHIAYMTAWVNKDGTVNFRRDIYGRDATLSGALFGPRQQE
jgi:murein L,D-transpeptidase YcbB/YkuD